MYSSTRPLSTSTTFSRATATMEFQRGERVNLNFDTGAVEKLEPQDNEQFAMPTFPTFVGDILERESSPANPPSAPSQRANVNGFPAHKKRIPRMSAFKQQRAAKESQPATPANPPKQDAPRARNAAFDRNEEKRAIGEENKRTLASMSSAEIEQERQELMQNLSPAFIQKLMARANIDEGSNERDLYPEEAPAPRATNGIETAPKSKPSSEQKVSFAAPEPADTKPTPQPPEPPTNTLHFPTPSQLPNLDPSSPTFLTDLHTKYFPTLPYNPSTQSWLAPIDPTDTTSPYHPSHTGLSAPNLRFDFSGTLLPPSVARSIPSDRGLHHHADAPEAAGYTIPELSVLSRSAVPAQRCMAYQTLGRILYRLGTGEYGVEKAKHGTQQQGPVQVVSTQEEDSDEEDEEDVGSAMAAGLWSCMEEGRVVETLTEEAGRERGHLTARTMAQEALWNWRRGGGRKRQAV